MALYLAVNNKQVLLDKITFKLNNNKDLIAYKNLDDLRDSVMKRYGDIKGWYYIEIDMNKDKLDEDDDAVYNKHHTVIDRPATIRMKNKQPLPLMDDGKIWKPIPEFSKYLASDVGEILTLKTGNYTKGVTAGHYLKVSLIKDKRSVSKMEYVHILICKTFHGPGKKGQVVMHMDDDKFNCKEDNLKWGSQSQNIQMVWDKRKEVYNMENYNIIKDLNDTISKVEHLKPYTDTISAEDGFISRINDYVLGRIAAMTDVFKVGYDKLSSVIDVTNSLDTSDIRRNALKAPRELKDVKFKEVDGRLSPVTLGMNTDLISFNKTLTKYASDIDETVVKSLEELNVALSSIMSDESYRKSFKPKDLNNSKVQKIQWELMDDIRGLVDPKSNVDRLKVSSLIPNIGSVGPLAVDTAKLANGLKKNRLDYVSRMVNDIHEKVDILHGYITDEESNFVISKNALSSLSYALDVNAELVTVYSSYYVLVNQQVGMVCNLIEIIKK